MSEPTKIAYATRGDFAALYIDDRLAVEMEADEMNPLAVIEVLVHRGFLENIEVEEIIFHGRDQFPQTL